MKLSLRQKLTYGSHLYKALFKSYHQPVEKLLRGYITPDSTVIDIGGHAGQFTKIFSRIASNGYVYTFEPGNYACSILQRVIKFHKLQNVEVIKKGVSDEVASKHFSVPIKRSGSVGFGTSHIRTQSDDDAGQQFIVQTIDTLTLDEFAKERDLKRIDFIKMDIEGHEMQAFYGMKSCIKNFRPIIMVELSDTYLAKFGYSKRDAFTFFEQNDYRILALDDATGTLHENRHDGDYLMLPS